MAAPIPTVVPVPDAIGDVSAWVASDLVFLTSETIPGAAADDAIAIFVSGSNATPPDASSSAWGLTGPNVRVLSLPPGAFYAVQRLGGSTTGLSLSILGQLQA